jgi:membrane-associated phospholipid phosphatase
MKKFRELINYLTATDMTVISFGIFLTILNIIFHQRVSNWPTHVTLNIFMILFVFLIAYLDKKQPRAIWTQLHYWYLVPLIFLIFKEIYFMVDPIRGVIYDDILIEIDRFIFGFDPTVELYKISNPLLTEALQIVYGSFFFLPIILGIDLLLTNKDDEFKYEAFTVIYGFFLSYIGYFLVPAIGPRFTLHEFELKNIELPGILLTNFLREIVNSGESIPAGTPNPAQVVQRDAFPSGHTQITLIVMYLSVRFKSKTRYALLTVGTLLIFATVYLRYHYVIDLIAGGIFMIFTVWTGYYIYNWWMKVTGNEKFRFRKY